MLTVAPVEPVSDFLECFTSAIALAFEQRHGVSLAGLIAGADSVAAERVDRARREIAQFESAAQGFDGAAVPGKHERDGLRRDAELLGDLPKRVSKPAEHRDFADALRHGIEVGGLARIRKYPCRRHRYQVRFSPEFRQQ